MDRIRTRDLTTGYVGLSPGNWAYTHYRPNGTPSSQTGTTPVTWGALWSTLGYEFMIDGIGPVLQDRQVVHCKAIRRWLAGNPYTQSGGLDNTLDSYTVYGGTVPGQAVQCSKMGPLAIATPEGAIDGLTPVWPVGNDARIVQNLYAAARKPVVDGMVNLVEADQIPGSLVSMGKLLSSINGRSRYTSFQAALRTLRRKSKVVSGAYLAYQFGIAPLLRDIHDTSRFMDDQARLFSKFASESTFYKSLVLTGYMQGMPTQPPPGGGRYSGQFRLTMAPTLRYTLAYRYKRFLKDSFVDKLQFLSQKLGFASPSDIAWELIPYSFVVDWFIDTTGLLMSLDDFLGLDPIQTISCVKSRKWQGETDHLVDVWGYQTLNLKAHGKFGLSEYSWYERSPIGRTTYVGPSNRFGKKQVLLSLALALQRA